MPDLVDERLDQIRERARIGTVREAVADRDFLVDEVDRLRRHTTEVEDRLAAGVAQAKVARGGGTTIVMALTGDPGAVVEADPYSRTVDA